MDKQTLIDTLFQGLIVSCQAVPSEPHFIEGIIPKMAECAKWAGAAALRVDTPENIIVVKKAMKL
jgi:N-acylglucosamine-6-phosphate 2-epimerase